MFTLGTVIGSTQVQKSVVVRSFRNANQEITVTGPAIVLGPGAGAVGGLSAEAPRSRPAHPSHL